MPLVFYLFYVSIFLSELFPKYDTIFNKYLLLWMFPGKHSFKKEEK